MSKNSLAEDSKKFSINILINQLVQCLQHSILDYARAMLKAH